MLSAVPGGGTLLDTAAFPLAALMAPLAGAEAHIGDSNPVIRNRFLADPLDGARIVQRRAPVHVPMKLSSLGQGKLAEWASPDSRAAARSMATYDLAWFGAKGPKRRDQDADQAAVLAAYAVRSSPRPAIRPRSATPQIDKQAQDRAAPDSRSPHSSTLDAPVVSSSGALMAPLVLGELTAPLMSPRPRVRTPEIEARVVRYSRSWLRGRTLQTLSEQESCLATAIYHEARGESLQGQFAVAEVILNRVGSRHFPGSICGVVYQGVQSGRYGGCQFSFACDGRSTAMPNRGSADIARRIAQVMARGGHRGLTDGAKYFHTHQVSPVWSTRFTQTTRIGAHLFYKS